MVRRSRLRAIARVDSPEVDLPAALVIELVSTALASGTPIPRAFEVVGSAMDSDQGAGLAAVGRLLTLGATWTEAWLQGPRELFEIRDSLELSWSTGAPVAGLLASASARTRDRDLASAKARAQKLGVLVVLPLGLCFLPAFILLAIIPLLAHLGIGLLAR